MGRFWLCTLLYTDSQTIRAVDLHLSSPLISGIPNAGIIEGLRTIVGLTQNQILIMPSRGATIRRKLRKIDPFKPIELARRAQEQFIAVNDAIQR